MKFTELKVTERVANALGREGLTTIEQVINTDVHMIARLPDMGKVSMKALDDALNANGTPFKVDTRNYLQKVRHVPVPKRKKEKTFTYTREQLETLLWHTYAEGFRATGEGWNAEIVGAFELHDDFLKDRNETVNTIIDGEAS